jgi:hypothetical protein
MKGMLPGVAALVLAVGCGARTLLATGEVGAEPSEDASTSTGHLGVPGDDSTRPSGMGRSLVPLTPNSEGLVSGNAVGIQGSWYAYGDCWGLGRPPGACEQKGGFPSDECSSIVLPKPGLSFPESPSGAFCLTGKAAAAIDSPLGYANIFGIGIGVDFNDSGGMRMPYDAPSYNVIGLQFDITGVPTATGGVVRVELPTYQTSSLDGAYANWGETLMNPLPNDGKDMQILFADVGPFPGETPAKFDQAQLLSIQFLVPSEAIAIPVTNLCVSNLQAIVQN